MLAHGFTIPFLVATAALLPRTTLGAAACFVTISLQILSWQWGNLLAIYTRELQGVRCVARD